MNSVTNFILAASWKIDVREEWKRCGKISLHDKLLSRLLKDERHHTANLMGSTFVMRKLNNKKVLIVLDDVEISEQFEVLCSECEYAGPDSILIITTRNKHLLTTALVDEIYSVQAWNFDKSLELFSLHAFKERHPPKGYGDLSGKAVNYANGVPLALKILGTNLYSRSTKFWESELRKLRKCPNVKIQNVLQLSYAELDSLQKQIFLDIAFFFQGEHKDVVIKILDACHDLCATSGIEVLKDKALITISNFGIIQMHHLIQEMALNVVCHDIEYPGNRRRLRDIEEVLDVLENNKGSGVVEGIQLDLSQVEDLHLNADTFSMMTKLRILKLYTPSGEKSVKVHYPCAFNKFSDVLRYLEWNGYHLKSLPANFCGKMLVEIRMPHSDVIELWQGVQDVGNLARIDLRECKELKNIPDLSKASKLKWVNLTGCESLCDVHPSIFSIDRLETLILDGCKKLRSLRSEKHLRSLEKISVTGCTSLREFSVSSDSIKSLDLSKTGIEELDSSIGCLINLVALDVQGLGDGGNLPNELSLLKCLRDLRICNCRVAMDKEKLHVLLDGLTSLKLLHLKDCCNLSELPDNISSLLSHLEELRLDGSNIETLPESIKNLFKLRLLSVDNCRMLRSLPALPSLLQVFTAINCRALVTGSISIADMVDATLERIFISFENCTSLDEPSLSCIMDNALSAINNFAYLLSNKYGTGWIKRIDTPYWDLDTVKVCLPGSSVPKELGYRSRSSVITVNLPSSKSKLMGFIFCVVLSPSLETILQGAKIWCQCLSADGRELGWATLGCHNKGVTSLNSDHVYIWYDLRHFSNILKIYKTDEPLSFQFFVTNDMGGNDDDRIIECGIDWLLSDTTTFPRPSGPTPYFLNKKHHYSISEPPTSDENQERDLNESSSSGHCCLLDVLSCLGEWISDKANNRKSRMGIILTNELYW